MTRPMRWRQARFPDAGTRWDTPMNRAVWNRDHGGGLELWQGRRHLATVTPGGTWRIHVGPSPRERGREDSVEAAKQEAKQEAKRQVRAILDQEIQQ